MIKNISTKNCIVSVCFLLLACGFGFAQTAEGVYSVTKFGAQACASVDGAGGKDATKAFQAASADTFYHFYGASGTKGTVVGSRGSSGSTGPRIGGTITGTGNFGF